MDAIPIPIVFNSVGSAFQMELPGIYAVTTKRQRIFLPFSNW